jgi:hypothetical protein
VTAEAGRKAGGASVSREGELSDDVVPGELTRAIGQVRALRKALLKLRPTVEAAGLDEAVELTEHLINLAELQDLLIAMEIQYEEAARE